MGLGSTRVAVERLESVSIDPGQVVLGSLGEILMVSQALGEVGDGLDAIGVGRGDQGHEAVPDIGAVLGLVRPKFQQALEGLSAGKPLG